MKVILTQALENLGNEGDVVDVSDGYARNFLLPRKLALPATQGNLKRVEEIRKHHEHRREKALQENKVLAERLGQTQVKLSVKVGEEGKLFGSITASDIAKALKDKIGQDLDKRKIDLSEPIRRTGSYSVPIKLDHNIEATVKVEVVGA